MQKLVIVIGHPEKESLATSNAKALEKAGKAQGLAVEMVSAADYPWIENNPTLEGNHIPEAFSAITDVLAKADFIAFTAPMWNFAIPPILSNFFLGIVVPGKFFNFLPGGKFQKLLKTKKVLIVWTAGGPTWVYRFIMDNPLVAQIKDIFKFCGAKKIDQLSLGNIHGNGSEKEKLMIQDFLKKLENYKF